MAKKTVAAPAVGEQTLVTYRVAEGVSRINGRKVDGPTIDLTPAEALYDLSLGRLTAPALTDGGN